MEFRDILKTLRKKKKITQEGLAAIIGVERSSVGKYETGVIPSSDILLRIADYFHVSVDYLLGREDDPAPESDPPVPGLYPIKKKKFPVLGKVACGEPIFAEEDRETWIKASADIDADFCLIAQGDSMIGAHIEDGDIIFIKQMPVVPNGKIAVVLIEDEATVKYIDFRPDTHTLLLHAANPAYRTLVYVGEELEQIRILGQAVVLQKSLM